MCMERGWYVGSRPASKQRCQEAWISGRTPWVETIPLRSSNARACVRWSSGEPMASPPCCTDHIPPAGWSSCQSSLAKECAVSGQTRLHTVEVLNNKLTESQAKKFPLNDPL